MIPAHSKDTQYYKMESTLQKHALDGTIQGTDIYRVYLRCVPSANALKEDEYTCLRFTLQVNGAAEIAVPSLTNWKYYFSLNTSSANKKSYLFGIDHAKFENLTDENGKPLPLENTFHVYNAFIDFHTMSVFYEKTPKDSGIQNLQHIGDKIVHSASFSQPQENLGSNILEGSHFLKMEK